MKSYYSYKLTDYFKETWIGRTTGRSIRRPSICNLILWNQYDTTLARLPKTHDIEGCHRTFSSLSAAFHSIPYGDLIEFS